MNVIEYVTEEVRRQGHDVTVLDGIERVAWMLDAWTYALYVCGQRRPTIDDAEALGKLIERKKNDGFRTCGVRVGKDLCPPWKEISPRLTQLFFEREKLDGSSNPITPLDFYREFELIHPFVDGNGRTGKILLNWLNGTILDPIFPPSNFWGDDILNP
jgi:hypothetical protein